jgi:hypothetical protein
MESERKKLPAAVDVVWRNFQVIKTSDLTELLCAQWRSLVDKVKNMRVSQKASN